MHFCTSLEGNVCQSWATFGITTAEALQLGGAFLGVTALAWSASFIARVILNR